MKKACTSRAFAQSYQFSAAEYLPITDSTTFRTSTNIKEPDWDSIMIYETTNNGVLTKPNGQAITQNLAPSPRDIAGLNDLYKVSHASKFDPYGSKSSIYLSKFKEIRKKDQDSGCSEAEKDSDTSAPIATAKLDCKAIGEELVESMSVEPFEKRNIGNILHSRHIEKRSVKSGMACVDPITKKGGWKISSFDYPSAGEIGDVSSPDSNIMELGD